MPSALLRSMFLFLACIVFDKSPAHAGAPLVVPKEWLEAPAFREAIDIRSDGVKGIFFEGPPYHGKPTEVFAWVGLPKVDAGKKVPGIVLIHGGGGTAFANWVNLWTSRGYAAIAMDTCGQVPIGTYGQWQRHEPGGPLGWDATFEQAAQPIVDQWPYHAVGDVILAHSLLRSLPEVDADRIGMTGISWGGWLTCIVAGLDGRFKFAVPVYGCGFLGDDSYWKLRISDMGDNGRKWTQQWDPLKYLPEAKLPMLWLTGTNDFAYPLDSLQKSYRLPSGERTVCIRLRMIHGHGPPGEGPQEILTFANSVVSDGPEVCRILKQEREGGIVSTTYTGGRKLARAELLFTANGDGPWKEREWDVVPADLDLLNRQATAKLPENVKVYFINLIDESGQIVSTEHVEVKN